MTAKAPVRPTASSTPVPPGGPVRRRRIFPGERRVWQAAAAVAVILAVVGTIELLRPRVGYTGTNSVGTRSVAIDVPAGKRLCVGGLLLPAGTGAVQLEFMGPGAQPRLDGALTVAGRTERATVPAGPAGQRRVAFAVAPRPDGAAPAEARFCVVPRGAAAALGGMLDVQGDQVAPTVDGAPVAARVAVWFLPPAGEQTSLLSELPEIARRAALFRAGWVGPWTYWAILFLLTPALGYAALRLLARAVAGETSRMPAAAAIALIALGNGAAFATLTPAFQTPDEPDHAAYVQILAETGHRPTAAPVRGAYSQDQVVALDAVRAYSTVELWDGRPPWLQADVQRWRERAASLPMGRDEGGGPTTPGSHRPGYYLLAAPAYIAARGDGFFAGLWAMRLVSALLGAITAACTVLFLRNLFPRAPVALAVVAGLLVAFLPQFAFMSGAVNNDAGITAFTAVTLWLAARAVRRGLDWRSALPLGAAAALLPLFKATGIAVYPAIGVAVLAVLLLRRDRTALAGLGALAAGLAAGHLGIVAVDQLVTPVPVPSTDGGGGLIAAGGVVSSVLDAPTLFLSYLWQTFLPPLPFMTDFFTGYEWPAYDTYVEEGFASFGWYSAQFAPWVYQGIAVAVVAVVAAAVAALWRQRGSLRQYGPQVALVILVIAGVLGGVTAAYTSVTPRAGELPEQGRYAFTALPAFGTVAAIACLALPRRRLGWAAGVLVAGMIALEWASQFMLLQRFYT